MSARWSKITKEQKFVKNKCKDGKKQQEGLMNSKNLFNSSVKKSETQFLSSKSLMQYQVLSSFRIFDKEFS